MLGKDTAAKEAISIGRRNFLRVGLATVAATALLDPINVLASYNNTLYSEAESVRKLALININTDENVRVDYWVEGRYIPDALDEINRVLRDHHDGSVHIMDQRLLDVLYGLSRLAGNSNPIEVVCGYRSHQTNAYLHATRYGVSAHSLHMQGKAVDIRLPTFGLDPLYRAALSLRAGGVGFYSSSNFIHVDTGPVRTWGGDIAEEDAGDVPEWRDTLLSNRPAVEPASNTSFLPKRKPVPDARHDDTPLQPGVFSPRRKPQRITGG